MISGTILTHGVALNGRIRRSTKEATGVVDNSPSFVSVIHVLLL
jgi:hypothetical protein